MKQIHVKTIAGKLSAVLFCILLCSTTALAAWTGRNAKLRDIPDRTWLNVCKYNGASDVLGGSSEVPWTYDMNSKLFVRVGGCTGGYTNSVVLFDLGTETTTAPWGGWDITGPANRPGGGCQRGVAYDPITKIVYEMGGGASSNYGVYGWWKGDMVAGTWSQYRTDNSYGGQVQIAADTANRVIVHTGRRSGFRRCYLYYPAGDSLVQAPVRPGSTDLESAIDQDWWPTMQYAPGLGGTMYFAWMNGIGWFTWLFNAGTRTWTDLSPTGLENSPAVANYVSEGFRPVISWDNANNVMLLHIPAFGIYVYNATANRWDKVAETNPQPTLRSQMFDYDDEHNVHVMASYNYAYDQDIWAFRYSSSGSAIQSAPVKAAPAGLRLDCSPNPFQTSARITFKLRQASPVKLALYDVRGQLIKTLIHGTRQPGEYAETLANGMMAPGLYAIRLDAGREHVTRQVLLSR